MRLLRSVCRGLAIHPVSSAQSQQAPLADCHQHLFSLAIATLLSEPPPAAQVNPITASDLVSLLDEAGMKRAAVLSVAYTSNLPPYMR